MASELGASAALVIAGMAAPGFDAGEPGVSSGPWLRKHDGNCAKSARYRKEWRKHDKVISVVGRRACSGRCPVRRTRTKWHQKAVGQDPEEAARAAYNPESLEGMPKIYEGEYKLASRPAPPAVRSSHEEVRAIHRRTQLELDRTRITDLHSRRRSRGMPRKSRGRCGDSPGQQVYKRVKDLEKTYKSRRPVFPKGRG